MVVDAVADEREREVVQERERGGVLAELRRRGALEVALEAEALELVPVREDVRERARVAREDALEVEVREAPDRHRLGGEAPVGVVQREVADGGLVLEEEVVDLRRRAAGRVQRELHDVFEPREAQLPRAVGWPGSAETVSVPCHYRTPYNRRVDKKTVVRT